MKNKMKMLFVAVVVFVSGGLVFSIASAQEAVAAQPAKVQEAQNVKASNPNANPNAVKTQTETVAATDATATAATDPQDKGKKDKPKDNKVKITADNHRSTVATFVQSLLAVADREGGIGQQVREIAQQQNDTKDRAADLISAVEGRSKIKTFFIGTSYKNTGELRSQMVQTKNQIDQLKKLADKAENDQDKAELQAQIRTLEQEQSNIDAFIAENENKFSLFGWAVKLFRK